MISVSSSTGFGEDIILSPGDSEDLVKESEEEEVLLASSDVRLFLSSGLKGEQDNIIDLFLNRFLTLSLIIPPFHAFANRVYQDHAAPVRAA